ncbi:MAG: hypothetical protein QGF09_12450, partial [Rhodospirillales bacterium]|nr:hypothetical protein [Rhodospirillales bacterium]
PDLPLAGRSLETENLARQQGEMSAMASRLEERLAKDPGNRAGWQLLARTYWSGGNFARAAEAFRRAHELAQGNATIAADYAETLVMADKGAFSETARAVFAKALAWNKLEPKSLFYQGLDLAQRGKNAEAMQVWINLINISPPGAPWMATVGGRIQALAKASGIDPASIKPTLTAPKPPPSKTTPPALSGSQMMEIRAMVQRLAERLKKEPNDLEGWRMLARSYRVLGEKQKVAQVEARIKALSGSP